MVPHRDVPPTVRTGNSTEKPVLGVTPEIHSVPGRTVGGTCQGRQAVENLFLSNGIIAGAWRMTPLLWSLTCKEGLFVQPIVSNYGGSFIPVSFGSSDNRVNMFDLRVGFEQPAGSKILSLNAIFTAMLGEDGRGIAKETQSILERAVKRMYDSLFKEEPRLVRNVKITNEDQQELLAGAPSYDTYIEYRTLRGEFLVDRNKRIFFGQRRRSVWLLRH